MKEQEKEQLRSRAAQRLDLVGPQKVDLVMLPTMGERLLPVSEERKERLASNIEEAFYARSDRNKAEKDRTPLSDEALVAVCSACRGACCKAGEDHAFLSKSVLSRVKRERKVLRNEAILDLYLGYIPQLAREGSCIFHASDGCALPRSMRSDTCNRYLCRSIDELGQSFGHAGYAQLAVVHRPEQEDRILLLSDDTTIRVDTECES